MTRKFVIIVIVLSLLVIASLVFSGRGYKETALEFVEALHKADADKMISLMSDDLLYELIGQSNLRTKKVFANNIEKALKEDVSDMKSQYGSNWKYKIRYVDTVKDNDSCIVILDVTYKGSTWFSEKRNNDTLEIELIRKGRNWYVNSFPDL